MKTQLERRTFLRGIGVLLAFGLAGCARTKDDAEPEVDAGEQALDDVQPVADEQALEETQHAAEDSTDQKEGIMQISVLVNDVPFTATIDDTAAGQELLARLPITLSMEELHGNEKYCYTGKDFGGEQYVPDTIEAGDLMVFGSDCLVLFYETFANGGWGYARVGKIDDPSGLAEACGSGTAAVTFESIA